MELSALIFLNRNYVAKLFNSGAAYLHPSAGSTFSGYKKYA
jgi:hypothetical protein